MKTLRYAWPKPIAALIALAGLAFTLGLVFGQEDMAKTRGRGYVPPTSEQKRVRHAQAFQRHGNRLAIQAKFQALPAAFDCRDKGWVPPIDDQASCGSCYLVATTNTITAALIKAGWGKPDGSFRMSSQFGMDCHNFGGCNGGNGTEVIEWMVQNGWYAETYVDIAGAVHKDYPEYEARARTCRKVPGAKLWKIADWGFCTGDQSNRQPTTDEIKTAMFNHGVLNIAIAAGGQFGSGTGTITSLGSNIDHEIEVVAWDDNKDGGAFLLRNQWGTGWGNGGYRWCTYKASKQIVDWFWVSADPIAPPDPPPPPPPGQLAIVPASAALMPGGTQQFTANAVVNWAATAGGITNSGLYTAPSAIGTYTVTASLASDATKSVTAKVTVSSAPPPPPIPGGTVITIGADIKAGTYQLVQPGFELVPQGTLQRLTDINIKVKELEALLSPKAKQPTIEEPPVIEEPKNKEKTKPEEQARVDARDGPILPIITDMELKQTYDDAYALAVAGKRPLVIGVGCNPPNGEWVAWRTEPPFMNWEKACVVVLVPEGKSLYLRKTLPAGATAPTIRQSLAAR